MQLGDIYAVNLPATPGREQAGTRPAIIVQTQAASYGRLPTVVVVPLTSQLKAQTFAGTFLIQPDSDNNLRLDSVALVFQVRAIDKRAIGHRIGSLAPAHLEELRRQLRALLVLET